MSDWFDKIRDGALKARDEAEKFTKTAVYKTSSAVNKAKLSYTVSETEGKIKEKFAALGEILYHEYKSGVEFPENIDSICRQIDKLDEEVDEIKQQLAKMKNAVICPVCGEYNPEESSFCAKCGKHLTVEAEVEEEI